MLGPVCSAAIGIGCDYNDRTVACDNTSRCEAVGYQPDTAGREPVALHLVCEAGPRQPVSLSR